MDVPSPRDEFVGIQHVGKASYNGEESFWDAEEMLPSKPTQFICI